MNHLRAGPRLWYIVDARDMVVGRLASTIVPILIGKHKPIHAPPQIDCGDNVIIVNAKDVHFTGKKWEQKKYRHHTGYHGGLKEFVAEKKHDLDPTFVLKTAISRMLPKNKMRKVREGRLHVYSGSEHPFSTVKPIPYDPLGFDAVYKNVDY
ncbi:ribosomal protein L13 [Acrasis kona]|uniref:Ribosomal protein L13 n=1 Tax=Acrasis kona TaxID=1008807 RepID=A0AAW2YYZ3_9EUKA